MLRRRMMRMKGESDEPKYSLKNGKKTMSSGKYGEVSNGNHILLYGTISSRAMNFTDLTYGQTVMNNKPLWFTIPAGSEITFRMTFTQTTGANMAFAFRNTSNVSAISTGNFAPSSAPYKEVTMIADSDIEVTCFFVYFNNTNSGYNEADVELWVNDERWL